jgi:hypothetical protein
MYTLDSFCTLDYREACREFAASLGAEILRASMPQVDEVTVVTHRASFETKCIVDASG